MIKFMLPLGLLLSIAACGVSRSSPHIHQYTLWKENIVPSSFADPSIKTHKTLVGVSVSKLSKALNRPQVIERDQNNRILIHSQHRWYRSLAEQFSARLLAQLEEKSQDFQFVKLPWYGTQKIDFNILVEIDHFENIQRSNTRHEVLLEGRLIFTRSDLKPMRREDFKLSFVADDIQSSAIKSVIEAKKNLVDRLANQITLTKSYLLVDAK